MSYSVPDKEALKIKWHVDRLNADNDSKLVTRAKKKAFKNFLRSGGKKQKDAKRISMTDFEKKVKECSFNDKIFVELINSSSKKKKRKMVLCLLMKSYTWATLRLKGVNLKGVNLSGLDFINVEITDSNLRGANFENCHFRNVTIGQTNLRKTAFNFSKLRDVSFHNCRGTRHIMDNVFIEREDVIDSKDNLPEDTETKAKPTETISHRVIRSCIAVLEVGRRGEVWEATALAICKDILDTALDEHDKSQSAFVPGDTITIKPPPGSSRESREFVVGHTNSSSPEEMMNSQEEQGKQETHRNAAHRQVIQLIRDADIKVYNWESLILGKGLGDTKLHLKSMSEFDLDYAIVA